MSHHHGGPFSIPAINDYVPEKLKPWIMILFVIVIQFSGGIYLATANEMVGATALMQEDILMAGYASLIGMALTFTIMLRLKMRFTSKFSLLTCCAVLIVSNIICLYTNNIVVLVATCFIAGVFRMWGTFECNSTIQLWLTPNRDMSVFFCFIFLLVQGCMMLSGITNMYMALFANYEYMHWLIIGLLLFVMLAVMLLFNNKRMMMKPFPLYGIDWLGAFIWALILMLTNFILIYGDHYDWWYSSEIKVAALFIAILLPLQLYRASFIRHPFIPLKTFTYKAVYMSVAIYLIIDVFLAPAHLIEHIYFENVLNYDLTHLISVNWMGWIGIVAGAVFSYFYFAKKKNSYKNTFLIGFASLLLYQVIMYFTVDYQTTKEMLVTPVFFRNFGYVVVAITLQTNLTKVPFIHFFQGITVQAFVSAAIGSAWGAAILGQLFKKMMAKNFTLLSSSIDSVNTQAANIADSGMMMQVIQRQSLMVTFKELYGILIIAGLIFFLIFILYRYPALPTSLYPTMGKIKAVVKRQLPRKVRVRF